MSFTSVYSAAGANLKINSIKVSQKFIFAIINYLSSHFIHSFLYKHIKFISIISRLKFALNIFNISESKRSEQYQYSYIYNKRTSLF